MCRATIRQRLSSFVLFTLSCALAVLVALILSLPVPAHAGTYSFTKIAGTDDFFRRFGDFHSPINASGTVLFVAVVQSGPEELSTRLLTGDGNQLTTIFDGGTSGSFDINASGIVAFATGIALGGTIVSAVLTGSGGPLTPIAVSPPTIPGLFGHALPTINDAGSVAFAQLSGPYEAILEARGGTLATVLDNDGIFRSFAPCLQLNQPGAIAFQGFLDDVSSGVFVVHDGTVTTIADDRGRFNETFPCPSINSQGQVAFVAVQRVGGAGIFTSTAGQITTVADTSGPFRGFSSFPTINGNGVVAFDATLDDGGEGIFVTVDGAIQQVIRTGDALFGSTVVSMTFPIRHALNDAGQIAFVVTLADGSGAVVRADPVQEAAIVPTSKEECQHGGWKTFGTFKTQGDCVQFVNTGK
jgi:hypothetical protein